MLKFMKKFSILEEINNIQSEGIELKTLCGSHQFQSENGKTNETKWELK